MINPDIFGQHASAVVPPEAFREVAVWTINNIAFPFGGGWGYKQVISHAYPRWMKYGLTIAVGFSIGSDTIGVIAGINDQDMPRALEHATAIAALTIGYFGLDLLKKK